MMRIWTILATALLVAGSQFVAHAAERNQFNQKDVVTVDPQKTYIFFRSRQKMELRFVRAVDAREQAEWEAARAVALVRARERYQRQAANYESAVRRCRGVPEPCINSDRPEPVTDRNFGFPPPEVDNFSWVSRGPQFTRAGDDYTYLLTVPPGNYTLYGQIASGANGAVVGTCLCMGSVRFEAPAGQIVDLGEIRYPAAEALRGRATIPMGTRLSSVEVVPYAPSMPRPDRLAGRPVVPAELHAADKMPNYFGILIDRLPAIPGVLGYRRDRVIDERTGQALVEPGTR